MCLGFFVCANPSLDGVIGTFVTTMKLPAILAFVWLVIKSALLQFGMNDEKYGVMMNLFFLVLVIFLAIRSLKEDVDFFPMLKTGMRPAAIYIILVTAGIFIYYQWMDPGYMPGAIQKSVDSIELAIEDEGGFEKFKAGNPTVKEDDMDSYIKTQRENLGTLFSPFGRASQSLLALTMMAFLYTLMMVGVYKIGKKFIQK